jgi:hypothetical protein
VSGSEADQPWLEALVVLQPGADRAEVARWLSGNGLAAMDTATGLLARGYRPVFEAAFGVSLGQAPTASPQSLPVPAPVRHSVATISLLPTPEPHDPNRPQEM